MLGNLPYKYYNFEKLSSSKHLEARIISIVLKGIKV